jgi:hypothetical protein
MLDKCVKFSRLPENEKEDKSVKKGQNGDIKPKEMAWSLKNEKTLRGKKG